MIQVDKLIKSGSVHARLYTEQEIFQQEMHEIFGQGWVYVGHESEVPKRGDFLPVFLPVGGGQIAVSIRWVAGCNSVAGACAKRRAIRRDKVQILA